MEKISSEKSAQKVFYIHTNIMTKKTRNTFFRNTRIVRAKNVGEKYSGKSAKKTVLLYSHEYRDPKGGKKRETSFPETHE